MSWVQKCANHPVGFLNFYQLSNIRCIFVCGIVWALFYTHACSIFNILNLKITFFVYGVVSPAYFTNTNIFYPSPVIVTCNKTSFTTFWCKKKNEDYVKGAERDMVHFENGVDKTENKASQQMISIYKLLYITVHCTS